MLAFIGFSAIAAIVLKSGLPDLFALAVEPLHHACTVLCPSGRHTELYSAIVCGSALESDSLRDSFARTGLIHLLVVSGSHLVFLEAALRLMLPRRYPAFVSILIGLVLLIFSLVTLLQPPVLRSFLSWLANSISERFRLGWPPIAVLVSAGAATLFFCRTKGDVLSLGLSWAASLGLHFASAFHERSAGGFSQRVRSWVLTHVTVYALLWMPLLSISVANPVSIVCNLLLGPVIGLVLFPASVIAICIKPLACVSDFLWDLCVDAVQFLSGHLPSLHAAWSPAASWTIVYIGILTLSFHWSERCRD